MKRKEIINKEIVPTDAKGTIYVGGDAVGCKLDKSTVLYLFREQEETEEGTQTRAFFVEVENPVTRGKAINAAEMAAYGLHDALEVASFGTSLARKARVHEDAEEVVAHDEFIQDVKSELTAIGIFS